jgi:hypothetical protein
MISCQRSISGGIKNFAVLIGGIKRITGRADQELRRVLIFKLEEEGMPTLLLHQ